MKTRPEYREATKEGKPKSMMGRSLLGLQRSGGRKLAAYTLDSSLLPDAAHF